MGVKELERMLENWPDLKRIDGLYQLSEDLPEEIKQWNSDHFRVQDIEQGSQIDCLMTGTRNKKQIPHAIGLSNNIRFYRYKIGQSFGTHYDESVVGDVEKGAVSEYTVLINLSGEHDSDLIGGETIFYPKIKKPLPTAPTTSTGPGTESTSDGRGATGKEMAEQIPKLHRSQGQAVQVIVNQVAAICFTHSPTAE
ncbi:hypothetical protein BG005_000508 [Podila minutissima]|nr:hypothetical protein BG005_000508 [Podila minutissima]